MMGDEEDTYTLGEDGIIMRQDRLVLYGFIDHCDIRHIGRSTSESVHHP